MTADKEKSGWGGPRTGAGRPRVLSNPTLVQVLLEPPHLSVIETYQAKHQISNRSDAVRRLLEDFQRSVGLG